MSSRLRELRIHRHTWAHRTTLWRGAVWLLWLGAAGLLAWRLLLPASAGNFPGVAALESQRVLACNRPGIVADFNVAIGEAVRSGQPVATLDDSDLTRAITAIDEQLAALDAVAATNDTWFARRSATLIAETDLRGSDAAAQTLRAEDALRATRRGLLDARTELAAHEAELQIIDRSLQRRRDLVARGVMAEDAVVELESQHARLSQLVAHLPQLIDQAAEDTRALARHDLDRADSTTVPELLRRRLVEQLAAERALEASRQALERLRLAAERDRLLAERARLTIRSPVEGTVIAILQDAGVVVEAGTELVHLTAAGTPSVTAYVRPDVAVRLQPADAVTVTSPADPTRSIPGHIRRIHPVATALAPSLQNRQSTALRGVRVDIDLDLDGLIPGERVSVALERDSVLW